MGGAQNWSVRGIDPKVREAAREAAARQGMSLGEYLNQALQNHKKSDQRGDRGGPQQMRARQRLAPIDFEEDLDDWRVSGPIEMRSGDPLRLAQRIDSIERRTQLAITGLDRAVSTIDRSMLGLSARIDDVENVSTESAERIAEALDHFRLAGDTVSGRLAQSESEIAESRKALGDARSELAEARHRLEAQVAAAEDVARKAQDAANFLSAELETRSAAFRQRLGDVESRAQGAVSAGLAAARSAAEEAANQAAVAALEAVAELRALQADMSERVAGAESSARQALETAQQEGRSVREALIEEVLRLESEIGARSSAADEIKTQQAALMARIEKAELGAREATAGLRQAAGAAIADLRNAQLGLAARVKQIEDVPSTAAGLDVSDLIARQAEITERLAKLEASPAAAEFAARLEKLESSSAQEDLAARLAALEADESKAELASRLEKLESEQRAPAPVDASPVDEALAAFERRLAEISEQVDQSGAAATAAVDAKLSEVDGAVKTLDASIQRLADRIAETESTANNAIRTLEETVSGLSAKVDSTAAANETEVLRAMLESRLDTMMKDVSSMVGEAKSEIAGQVSAALEGAGGNVALECALEDVNRRLAAAERRQAQTIEAISVEIKRMSETVDRRLRTVETANDGAAASAVREEMARMGKSLEDRFEEIERREAAAFDRMGLEVGRLSERLEDRVGAVETRSAQAIEQVGEQVARMAERFNQRQEMLARELGERMIDSEERSGARVSDAIASIMQRLSEVEEHSAEAVAPVQKAVSGVASRLNALESGQGGARSSVPFDDAPLSAPSSYVSPMDAAAPMRAGPLPSAPPPVVAEATPETIAEPSAKPTIPAFDDDIYFDDDDASTDSASAKAQAFGGYSDDDDAFLDEIDAYAPPPEDGEPLWTPEDELAAPAPEAASAPPPEDDLAFELDKDDMFADEPAHQAAAPEQSEGLDADFPVEPAPPAGKNDYLAAARKAAQAQAAPAKPQKEKARKPKETKSASESLRGSSRVVLWGATGAIALLVAGGWYLNQQQIGARPAGEPSNPDPDIAPPLAPPPAQAYEPAGEPGSAESESLDGAGGPTSTEAPADAEPMSEAQPLTQTASARAVAGPLAPRAVSLDQAARNGDVVAQYELGLQRLTAGRAEEGVALLRRAADRGLAMAQYRLAKVYERGEGVSADLNQARVWTERAAGAGNRRAMHDLGVYFARGEGAPLDEAAAFRWFRQAAELGVADSQYNLGVLYQQGRGVGASPAEAMFWFMVAARQGDEDAGARAAALENQLQPIQVEQARARAQAFRPRAASAAANGEFGPRAWAPGAART